MNWIKSIKFVLILLLVNCSTSKVHIDSISSVSNYILEVKDLTSHHNHHDYFYLEQTDRGEVNERELIINNNKFIINYLGTDEVGVALAFCCLYGDMSIGNNEFRQGNIEAEKLKYYETLSQKNCENFQFCDVKLNQKLGTTFIGNKYNVTVYNSTITYCRCIPDFPAYKKVLFQEIGGFVAAQEVLSFAPLSEQEAVVFRKNIKKIINTGYIKQFKDY
jgi:hypothetical protein